MKPLISTFLLTLTLFTVAPAQTASPALTAQSSAEEIASAAENFASSHNDTIDNAAREQFVQQVQAVDHAALINALLAVPKATTSDSGKHYHVEGDLLSHAIAKLSTETDIPALLNGNRECLRLVWVKKWTGNPKVTDYLAATITGWGSAAPSDNGFTEMVLMAANANPDPKITTALDQAVSQLSSGPDLDRPTAIFLLNLAFALSHQSKLYPHIASILSSLTAHSNKDWDSRTLALLDLLVKSHPDVYDDADTRAKAVTFARSHAANVGVNQPAYVNQTQIENQAKSNAQRSNDLNHLAEQIETLPTHSTARQ